MVFQAPEEGTLASQLGSALGKGVSTTLPEAMKQGALSQGLRSLQQKGAALKPLERMAQMYSIPGMTPDIAKQAEQYSRDEARLQARQRRKEAIPPSVGLKETISPEGEDIAITEKIPGAEEKETAFIPRGEILRGKEKQLKRPTPKLYNERADDLYAEGGFQTWKEARDWAKSEVDQEFEQEQGLKGDTRKIIEERVRRTLQNQGLDDTSEIWGELTQSLLDQANHLVLSEGLSPEAASDRIESLTLDLGKKMNKLGRITSSNELFKLPQTKLKDIKPLRKDFKDVGAEQQFDEAAIAQLGIDPRRYASILNPVKNAKIKKEIGTGLGRISDKRLDKIAKDIRPEDSIWSIMYDLGTTGTAAERFKDILQDKYYDRLTKSQKQQVDRAISPKSGVMDIYFDTFGKLLG